MTYSGSCHCKAVQFDVDADDQLVVHECNCSMCSKSGHLHLIVPKKQFHLRTGDDHLQLYQFNTRVAKHYFCKTCGVKSFYVPRSNPDGISVNARCLDPVPDDILIESFEGSDWEQHAHTLAHLSKE